MASTGNTFGHCSTRLGDCLCRLCSCHERQRGRLSWDCKGEEEEAAAHTPPPDYPPTTPKRTFARDAMNSAFLSYEDQPTWFPLSFYDSPARSGSKTRSSPPRPSITYTLPDRTTSQSTSDVFCSSPDQVCVPATSDPQEQSYAPLAAGIARLNCKDTSGDSLSPSERRAVSRSSLDLKARRMFEGPA